MTCISTASLRLLEAFLIHEAGSWSGFPKSSFHWSRVRGQACMQKERSLESSHILLVFANTYCTDSFMNLSMKGLRI